ncbi:MAG: Cyclic nucleotide-binding domain protein [Chthoniobacteraceae bacterium]|nr:Cyclic nucleotide-binding domain protein [Chthoniobacteraceae bacterium]
MPSILDLIPNGDVRYFQPGEVVMEQDANTGRLWFLIEGSVEVVKDGVRLATVSQAGAVFGELSALLDCNHTATVRALHPCAFRAVENPREFLAASPLVCLHVCELVARRLDGLNKYLVDVQEQFKGDDHIGMVDGVLRTLMHRHPLQRIRPAQSNTGQDKMPN